MTDCVEFIYISLLHFSQDVKLISYFDKTNKIAIKLKPTFFPLCNFFFLLCCRLNVSLNELYPDKTNKNKDYNFCITFFHVGSKMLLTFFLSINSRLLTRRIK